MTFDDKGVAVATEMVVVGAGVSTGVAIWEGYGRPDGPLGWGYGWICAC